MSERSAHEVRSSLVERMRGSGIEKREAERQAEQSVRRVYEQGEATGRAGKTNHKSSKE